MAVTTVNPPPPALRSSAVAGSHVHQCYRNNHTFTCQYTTSCQLEMIAGAQKIIDEMCPGCHNLAWGTLLNYENARN